MKHFLEEWEILVVLKTLILLGYSNLVPMPFSLSWGWGEDISWSVFGVMKRMGRIFCQIHSLTRSVRESEPKTGTGCGDCSWGKFRAWQRRNGMFFTKAWNSKKKKYIFFLLPIPSLSCQSLNSPQLQSLQSVPVSNSPSRTLYDIKTVADWTYMIGNQRRDNSF